ncbi:MAG TPA: DUF3530 domain-containing protein [Betaproteobacteria bacterium]|nr:DUF3530 domain-containing protein [Betaproteobacteria bacterium]
MRYAMLLLLVVFTTLAQAADYAREKQWANEIIPAIVVGEPVYLDAAGHRFLSLLTRAPRAKAAVVLIHGMGVQPNWGLIGVLRTRLPDAGYTTLSIQMPVLAPGAEADAYTSTFGEAGQRIAAAIRFLQRKGYRKIAVVSHSMGSRMADHYLSRHPAAPLAAWVAIGMPGRFSSGLTHSRFPVLDLFGEEDRPAVLHGAAQRAEAIRTRRGSVQIMAPGADHFFDGRDDTLVRDVRAFLNRAIGG